MSTNSLRVAYLLGEMRRQMNGAVVGAMRFYGAEYGLNYGVSIATIREIARREDTSHSFAKLLYRQEVRELRLAALWIADSEEVAREIDFWAAGIINSEVAEEAAFALLCRVSEADEWLGGDSEVLQYCALMSIASRGVVDLVGLSARLCELLAGDVHILSTAVVAVLDSALKAGQRSDVETFLEAMPEGNSFVREEMAWRLEMLS